MSKSSRSRKNLFVIPLLAVLSATAVTAQETNRESEIDPDTTFTLDAFEVTGTRLINRNAAETKFYTNQNVESIGEDESASFPGENAAETLADLAGITIQGNGETIIDRFVTIRGIQPSWNRVTLNGMAIATPDPSNRSQYLDLFPTNLANKITVYKTFTAENTADAIGGVTDFSSRRGSKYDETRMLASFGLSSFEHDQSIGGQSQPFDAKFNYSGKLSKKLSVSAALSFNHREKGQPSTLPRARTRTIDGITIPREYRLTYENTDVDRINANFAIEYAFSEDSNLLLTGGYNQTDFTKYHYKSDERVTGASYEIEPTSETTGFVVVDESNETGVKGDAHFSEVATVSNDASLTFVQALFDHQISENMKLELKSSFSKAEEDRLDRYSLFFHSPVRAKFAYDFTDIGMPTISLVEEDGVTLDSFYAPSEYHIHNDQYDPRKLEDEVIDLSASISSNAGEYASGFGWKAGLRHTVSDRYYDRDKWQYNATDLGAETFTLASILAEAPNVEYPGITSGRRALFGDLDLRDSVISSQVGNTDLFTLATSDNNDFGSDYGFEEATTAAFVMAQLKEKNYYAQAGLRYENTEYDGTGFRLVNGTYEATENGGSYDFLLPSASFDYFLQDNLRLSASVSETLARANYTDLAPRGEVLNLSDVGTGSLSRSNPDLKPRESFNSDVFLDWKIESGLISLGFFRKDIKNEIIRVSETDTQVIDGVSYDLTISQPGNAPEAELDGMTLAISTDLHDYIPVPEGFGVSGNFTWMSGDFEVPESSSRENPGFIITQPEETGSVSFYYSSKKLDFRVGYNYTGQRYTVFDIGNAAGDRYREPVSTFGAKVRYYLNDKTELFLSGRNLSSEDYGDYTAEGRLYRFRNEGESYTAGVVYQF